MSTPKKPVGKALTKGSGHAKTKARPGGSKAKPGMKAQPPRKPAARQPRPPAGEIA